MNSEGEFLAGGPCEVDAGRGEVTMWPALELHMLARQRGGLSLALDDGRTLQISERHLTFRVRQDDGSRTSIYKLRVIDDVPEHLQAGYREPEDEALMTLVREDEAARTESSVGD